MYRFEISVYDGPVHAVRTAGIKEEIVVPHQCTLASFQCLAILSSSQADVEKLQVLTLGVKLYLMGAKKSERILKHVLNLAKVWGVA